ncbi:2Fe-2S iron-sulfur cluster-binding protein [Desulfatirhabdium butyrativorans]|uniref:2Fe-2S iron-sulfur cluster-binding protein n=1 Tax=Desulfatirhabdium butyrativorans TaxID=340467 RepID=UPI00048829D7|nr:2Fe-2S iron-sulfur cluster-binding protein [Desulfatirhabdium butyrativorans]
MIQITINGRDIEVEEDTPLMKILREEGISIPSLCYHPALTHPIVSCRLCAVEIMSGKAGVPGKVTLACTLRTHPGLIIETDTDAVRQARTTAMNQLLSMAPQSEFLLQIAERYGLQTNPPPDGCIRCRLCVQICKEIVGAGALRMIRANNRMLVVSIPGNCIGCGTCANICPTKVIHVEDKDNVRTISIRDEIIGRHPLLRCEGCGAMFTTPRFLDHVHSRSTEHHPDVKEQHLYCPSCAKLIRRSIAAL